MKMEQLICFFWNQAMLRWTFTSHWSALGSGHVSKAGSRSPGMTSAPAWIFLSWRCSSWLALYCQAFGDYSWFDSEIVSKTYLWRTLYNDCRCLFDKLLTCWNHSWCFLETILTASLTAEAMIWWAMGALPESKGSLWNWNLFSFCGVTLVRITLSGNVSNYE